MFNSVPYLGLVLLGLWIDYPLALVLKMFLLPLYNFVQNYKALIGTLIGQKIRQPH